MAVRNMIALLFSCFLMAASAQDLDDCKPEAVENCYERYSSLLLRPALNPQPESKNDKNLRQDCTEIKKKAPCHLKLAKCSDDVKSTLRHREKGYEAARDIVCELTPWKDFGEAYQCVDRNLRLCPEPVRPPLHADQPGPPLYHPFCDYYERDIECLKFTFNTSCEITFERVKVAYNKIYDALALLRGCKESPPEDARKPSTPGDGTKPNSGAAFLQPRLALAILSLTLLLQRLTTP